MSKPIDVTALENEHQLIFKRAQSLCSEVSRQLQFIIEKQEIQLAVPIQSRAKDFSSILDKLKQGRFSIKKTILELQDLAGFRIITLFKRDAKQIVDLICNQFEVIVQYDTEERLQESEFGYSSIHLICKLKKSWLDIPSLADFKDFKFEIQVRTLSQHSWAEASNIFQYKKEDNVPKPLKRSISRISALLETVDLEFERLLTERVAYKDDIKVSGPENINIDQALNVDLLEEILDKRLPHGNKDKDEDYSVLLDNLSTLGYGTTESLNKLIDAQLDLAIKQDARISKGFKNAQAEDPTTSSFERYYLTNKSKHRIHDHGVYFTQTGLIRMMLDNELGEKWVTAYEKIKKKK